MPWAIGGVCLSGGTTTRHRDLLGLLLKFDTFLIEEGLLAVRAIEPNTLHPISWPAAHEVVSHVLDCHHRPAALENDKIALLELVHDVCSPLCLLYKVASHKAWLCILLFKGQELLSGEELFERLMQSLAHFCQLDRSPVEHLN